MRKVIGVVWFCAGHGNVGIVRVLTSEGEIKYYVGACKGLDAETDKKWIADWGSQIYSKEAGDLIFGIKE